MTSQGVSQLEQVTGTVDCSTTAAGITSVEGAQFRKLVTELNLRDNALVDTVAMGDTGILAPLAGMTSLTTLDLSQDLSGRDILVRRRRDSESADSESAGTER